MNIIKLLPVSFLHGQISCLIECLIGFVADHSNTKKKKVISVQNLSCCTSQDTSQDVHISYKL